MSKVPMYYPRFSFKRSGADLPLQSLAPVFSNLESVLCRLGADQPHEHTFIFQKEANWARLTKT